METVFAQEEDPGSVRWSVLEQGVLGGEGGGQVGGGGEVVGHDGGVGLGAHPDYFDFFRGEEELTSVVPPAFIILILLLHVFAHSPSP